jgi:hypothetical protein
MVKLGREMTKVLIAEFGPDEFIRRIADPVWFQSLGTVLAFDWNASGLTTILTAALKETIRGQERELGIFICGGKGKNNLVQEPKYLDAYAKYLAKYVTAYQAAGIPVFAVAVQNEPFFGPPYPSCQWTSDELGHFISDYMGPEFRNQKIDAELWLGSMNNGNIDAFTLILDNPQDKSSSASRVQRIPQ